MGAFVVPFFKKGGIYLEIFSLFATIGLKDDGFAKGIKGATDSGKGFLGTLGGMFSSVTSFIGTAAGVLGVSKAFEVLSSSVGAAVSRYDTLQQFPRVLQQIGYTSDEATDATKKLSEGINGLPTKLDDIVATAQSLTLLTGNLEMSTDAALALNNAFLASSASASDVSRGMIQYTQMLSKGKVDITSWRTLQETMTYSLTKTAEAFGYLNEEGQGNTNELYEALKNGEITFDEFNAKIIELNEGVGGFADVAQTASGGINTSFSIIKSAVERNLADMIGAIDDSLEQLGLPGIAETLKSFKDIINDVFGSITTTIKEFMAESGPEIQALFEAFETGDIGGIAEAIGNLIASVMDSISKRLPDFIKAGTEIISSIISGFGAALPNLMTAFATLETVFLTAILDNLPLIMDAALQLVSGFGQGIQTAWPVILEALPGLIRGIYDVLISMDTVILEAFTILLSAFSDVMPVIMDLIAVVLPDIINVIVDVIVTGWPLVMEAGVQLLSALVENLPEINDAIAKGIPPIIDALVTLFLAFRQDIIDAGVELLIALIDDLPNIIEGIKRRLPEIKDAIVSKFGEFKEAIKDIGRNILAGIWEGISEKTEWLKEQVGGVFTGVINGAKDVLGIASPSKEFAKIGDFVMKGFSDGIERSSADSNKIIKKTYGEVVKSANTVLGTLTGPSKIFSEMGKYSVEGLTKGLKNASPEATKSITAIGETILGGIKIDQWVNRMNDSAKMNLPNLAATIESNFDQIVKNISASMNMSKADAESWLSSVSDNLNGYIDALNEYVSNLESSFESYKSITTDMFSTISDKSDTSIAEMVSNMKENQRVVSEWATNIAELSKRGIDEGLLEELRQAGPESAGYVKLMVNASDEELAQLSTVFANGAKVATNSLVTAFDLSDVKSIGQNIMQGLSQGVEIGTDGTVATISNSTTTIIDRVKSILGIASPSKVFDDIGQNTMLGLKDGILSRHDEIVNVINQIIDTIKNTASVLPTEMYTIGQNLVDGMWEGMLSKRDSFYKNVYNFFADIVKEAKKALDIASPSKAMAEVGRFTAEGFIVGLESMADKLSGAVDGLFSFDASDFDFSANVTGTGQFVFASESGAMGGDMTINQYIQSVPQSPYEQAQQTAAAFRRARWEA